LPGGGSSSSRRHAGARAQKRVAQRALDGCEHAAAVGEAHLGLGGMHVDVDQVQRQLDEDVGFVCALAAAQRRVGLGHGLVERALAHGPPVHEQAQRRARRAQAARARGEAVHAHAVLAALDRHQRVEPLVAEELVQARAEVGGRRRVDHLATARTQDEAHPRMAEGQVGQHLGHVGRLGGVRAQELAPRGHLAEQVVHLDRCAPRVAHVAHLEPASVPHLDLGAGRAGVVARAQQQVSDAGDGLQALERRQLGRGVALESQRRIVARHAAAVVAHAHQTPAPAFDLDRDLRRAGVEGVFAQLLDHGGRALDHLAGGDLVDQIVG
jgi:hypothetical protein